MCTALISFETDSKGDVTASDSASIYLSEALAANLNCTLTSCEKCYQDHYSKLIIDTDNITSRFRDQVGDLVFETQPGMVSVAIVLSLISSSAYTSADFVDLYCSPIHARCD